MLCLYYLKLSELPEDFFRGNENIKGCEKVRREKMAGQKMLYFVLERYFHRSPETIRLYKNEHGKPYLVSGDPLFFNISHSGDFVICAFSDTEVGADIEKIGPARLAVAKRFFHPEETAALNDCKEQARDELFFRYWSGKESFLKCQGNGLNASLSSFHVKWNTSGGQVYQVRMCLPFFLHRCPVDEGYVCFVCSDQRESPEIVALTWQKGEWQEKGK